MLKTVKTKDLKVGMYVKLGLSWMKHSFLTPNFKITSEKQIKRIIATGIKSVQVDLSKSDVLKDPGYIDHLGKKTLSGRGEVEVSKASVDAERDLLKDLGHVDQPKASPDQPTGSGNGQTTYVHGRKQGDIALPEAGEFNPIDLVSEELRETIENTHIPPRTKAKAVYDHSIKMMNHVLKDPNAENILSGKKMVYEIVDHILADDETAAQMTKITSHDYYTYTHSVNVGMLAVLLTKSALEGTIAAHNMHELGAGFFLHDLGKCDVPVSLINKPDILSPEEWKLMREHPSKGNKLLSDTHNLSKETGVIIMQHHEREDGSGYPFGLTGHEIHFYGRICSIADVYDALTSTRAYKKKLPPFEALRIMKNEMIHHFHKDLFGVFLTLFD